MTSEQEPRTLGDADDRTLAGRATDGDTLAFSVLVRRYTPMMRAYARKFVTDGADIDDVVQEAFITAWQKLPDLDDPSRVKSWLMRITSRKALDKIRTRRESDDVTLVDPALPDVHTPARLAEARSSIDALRAALAELPEEQRRCWTLREIGELSYDEIAEQLGLSVSTVRGMLARARKTLIVRMEQWR